MLRSVLDRVFPDRASGGGAPPRLDLRLLVAAATGWVAVLIALRLPATLVLAWAGLAATSAVLLLRLGRQRELRVATTAALSCAAAALVLCATAGQLLARQAGPVRALAADRATVRVEAVVDTDPRPVAAAHTYGKSLVITKVSVREITGRGARSTPHTPVLVIGDDRWLPLHWHQRIAFAGRLQAAEPGDDVEAVIIPRGPPRVVGGAGPLLDGIERLRSDLRDATDGLPRDPRGLVPALVIGDTSRLPQELNDDMRATGMTHLNAVSGSNVTMVLLAAMWVAGWLRVRGRRRLVFAGVALLLFVLLCRPEPSVVRAAAMGAVGLVGLSTARRTAGAPALAAAVLALLVYDPWLAASYGFALSSLATAGLLFFARPWADRIARYLPHRLAPLAEAIAIPMAAQAMCAPVIVLLQGSVSLIGIPANVLAAPLVAPATLAGIVTVLVAPISTQLAYAPAWLAALPTWGIAWIAHTCARVPLGVLPWPDGALGALLLAGLTLVLLVGGVALLRLIWLRPYLAAAAALLGAAAWAPVPAFGWPPAGWVYVACDVGQGDGGVLATSPGHAVVVDAGPDPGPIAQCLDRLGVTVVDALVLTHFHADHVGGIDGVFRGRTVREIYSTPVHSAGPSSPGTHDARSGDEPSDEPLVQAALRKHGMTARSLQTGMQLHYLGLDARVLGPTRLIRAGSVQNNASVVLDVRSRGLRLLLTGDIEKEAGAAVLRALRAEADPEPVDVLKVPHHGSANQDPDLERAVHAPIAVISVGAGNDYGHPAPRTLDLLRDSNSTAFRTDRGGAIAIVARGGLPFVARP
nr:ComEC/Rec2 family competence protein [Flexivirga aerilata]